MASITEVFVVRNGAAAAPGARVTGLAPVWIFLKRLTDGAPAAALPTITEIGQGQYRFDYDAEANGEAVGQIDAGASLPNASDRFIDILLTPESGRILAALHAGGCSMDLSQAVPVANSAQTLGDCLNAARAQGFGKWSVVGAALTLYAPDGTTPVRIFTLDSAASPTTRT